MGREVTEVLFDIWATPNLFSIGNRTVANDGNIFVLLSGVK